MDNIILFNHEVDNFKKWFKANRQRGIGYNYKRIRATMEDKIKENSLFLPVLKLETIEENLYERIFLKGLFDEKEYRSPEYIELPSEISDYFWLKTLVELKNEDKKITEAFESNDRKQHEYMLESYLRKSYRNKYELVKDATFIASFTHDINLFDKNESTLSNDIITVEISKPGIDSIKKFKTKAGVFDGKEIQGIIDCIGPVYTYYGAVLDNTVLKLLRHMIPLIIFIAINLPKNEVLNLETVSVCKKLLCIILTACQDVLTLDSLDSCLVGKESDLWDKQKRFLLAASNSKGELKRALTNRDKGETTYAKRYSIRTQQLTCYPLEEADKHVKPCKKLEELEGDYNNLQWLFYLYSEAMDSYRNKSRDLSPQQSIDIFMTLLDSCKIKINDEFFTFNKSINLFVFNSLTKLLDAHLQVDQEGQSLIYGLNGLLIKKAILEDQGSLSMEDIDILNMIMWSIENIILHKSSCINENIGLDPYEYYKEAIFGSIREPKPKRNEDGSIAFMFDIDHS